MLHGFCQNMGKIAESEQGCQPMILTELAQIVNQSSGTVSSSNGTENAFRGKK